MLSQLIWGGGQGNGNPVTKLEEVLTGHGKQYRIYLLRLALSYLMLCFQRNIWCIMIGLSCMSWTLFDFVVFLKP